MRSFRDILLPLGLFAALLLAILTLSRVLLVGWQLERVIAAGTIVQIFVQGFRFDLIVVSFLLLPAILLIPLLCTSRTMLQIWRPGLAFYCSVCVAAVVFLEVSTMPFIEQFDARPNRLFFEYLAYPKEIASTLKAAYLPEIFGSLVLIAVVVRATQRLVSGRLKATVPVNLWLALALTPGLALASLLAMRGTLDHRALNPSTVALSTDPMVNELALNSSYSVLYALNEESGEPAARVYAELPEAEVIASVRQSMLIPAEDFVSEALPTLHRQMPTQHPAKAKNLVIILEESLGAEFVGALGGLPLTPRLDALFQEGLWFRNLYATGTRSVRGIEAVITGFTPTPAMSTVKLGGSQRNFFTLAQLLREQGYVTSFIYGGESHFDNMRRFFMNNGFTRVVDEKDYDDAVFFGSWGASDEDLFRHAHEEFLSLGDQPFFSLVFTTSNHTPYEFPDGRIELYDAEKATVNNAVKYADYALGQYIDTARQSSYWDDTIFLIVADHNSRVYGPDLVPVDRFHIPALALGGGIEPSVYEPVASQIDLPPTMLSLMGVSSENPMIGHDLTRPEMREFAGRAIMQFGPTQAYMQDDDVMVLRKDLPPEQFRYDGSHLIPASACDPDLLEKALAHADWSLMAYSQKLYRLPGESAMPVAGEQRRAQ